MSAVILGVPETIAAFERLALETEAAASVATQAGGAIVAEVMRAQAPKDTGRLAASIAVRRDGDDAIVGADVPYDRFVQKGTQFMDAQPYAEQAGDKAGNAAVAAMTAVFKAVLR
jgi:HK97 gp10 family phage protein